MLEAPGLGETGLGCQVYVASSDQARLQPGVRDIPAIQPQLTPSPGANEDRIFAPLLMPNLGRLVSIRTNTVD